jgi:hypothetical protein
LRSPGEHFRKAGGAEEPLGNSGEHFKEIPAEEFVSDAQDAIAELAHANEWFKKAGIEVVGVTFAETERGEPGRDHSAAAEKQQRIVAADEEGSPGQLDLDEFERGMYLCRWPRSNPPFPPRVR